MQILSNYVIHSQGTSLIRDHHAHTEHSDNASSLSIIGEYPNCQHVCRSRTFGDAHCGGILQVDVTPSFAYLPSVILVILEPFKPSPAINPACSKMRTTDLPYGHNPVTLDADVEFPVKASFPIRLFVISVHCSIKWIAMSLCSSFFCRTSFRDTLKCEATAATTASTFHSPCNSLRCETCSLCKIRTKLESRRQ